MILADMKKSLILGTTWWWMQSAQTGLQCEPPCFGGKTGRITEIDDIQLPQIVRKYPYFKALSAETLDPKTGT